MKGRRRCDHCDRTVRTKSSDVHYLCKTCKDNAGQILDRLKKDMRVMRIENDAMEDHLKRMAKNRCPLCRFFDWLSLRGC